MIGYPLFILLLLMHRIWNCWPSATIWFFPCSRVSILIHREDIATCVELNCFLEIATIWLCELGVMCSNTNTPGQHSWGIVHDIVIELYWFTNVTFNYWPRCLQRLPSDSLTILEWLGWDISCLVWANIYLSIWMIHHNFKSMHFGCIIKPFMQSLGLDIEIWHVNFM